MTQVIKNYNNNNKNKDKYKNNNNSRNKKVSAMKSNITVRKDIKTLMKLGDIIHSSFSTANIFFGSWNCNGISKIMFIL